MQKWHFGRAHVSRLINASEVAGSLEGSGEANSHTGGISEPENERQLRPIAEADLSPEKQREARATAHKSAGSVPARKDVEAAILSIERIEALSADDQAETVIRTEASRRCGRKSGPVRNGRSKQLELARRHSQRLRKTLEGLGRETDVALKHLDRLDDDIAALENA